MKKLITTTAVLSVGLTLGMTQPIQAQWEGPASNTPSSQEEGIQDDPSTILQQLQNKANSGKKLTQEELHQIQDITNDQEKARMKNNTPAEESTPTDDPSNTLQQLQNKANSGEKLTPKELRQLQSIMEEQDQLQVQENERMRSAEEAASARAPSQTLEQLEEKVNMGQRLTDEEYRQLQLQQLEKKEGTWKQFLTKEERQQLQILRQIQQLEEKANRGQRLTEEETQLLQSREGVTNRAPAIPTHSPPPPMRE